MSAATTSSSIKKLSPDPFVDTSYQDAALKAMGRVPEDLTVK